MDQAPATPPAVPRPPGFDFGHVIVAIILADALVVAAIILAVAPSKWWIIPAALGLPFLIFVFIAQVAWEPWRRRYPAQHAAPDAVVRSGQSVRLGRFLRMNNCLAVAVDEDHLHLVPFSLLRWCGAKVISIPWERAERSAPTPRWGLAPMRVDGVPVGVPGWAADIGLPPVPAPSPADAPRG